MTWKMDWAGHTFTDADVTIDIAAAAQMTTQDGWRSVDPLQGPRHAANLLALLVGAREGRPFDEVLAELGARPAADLVHCLGPATPKLPPSPVVVPDEHPPPPPPAPVGAKKKPKPRKPAPTQAAAAPH